MTRIRSLTRSRVAVRWLHVAAVLALVLSTLLGSVLQADPATAKDRGRKDGRPAAAKDRDARDGRIVNGTPAGQEEVPFAAYIQVEWGDLGWKCAGALVADFWVLTAKECIPGGGRIRVVLGSSDLENESARMVREAKIVVDGPGDTVSLLMLDRPVPLNIVPRVAAIGLPPATDGRRPAGEELVAAAWGLAGPSGEPTNILMTGTFPVADDDTCAARWSLTPSQLATRLCAGDTWSVSPRLCAGDLGAPLFQSDHSLLEGVALRWDVTNSGACSYAKPALFARLESPDIQRFLAATLSTTDDAPPTVAITGPANGAVVRPGFKLDATVTEDESGISVVEFWACANECTLLGKDSSAPYQQPNVTLATGKTYNLIAWAYDNAGNRGESAQVRVKAKSSLVSGADPKLKCCRAADDPVPAGFHVEPGQPRLFYRPGIGEATSLTLSVEATVKGGAVVESVTFPPLLGAAGGEASPVPGSPFLWQFTYDFPASGLAATAPQAVAIAAVTDGGATGETTLWAMPDAQAPTVRMTKPSKSPFETSGTVNVKVAVDDPSTKDLPSSGIAGVDVVVETYGEEVGGYLLPRDTQAPYVVAFTPERGSQGVGALATDNVGNVGRTEDLIQICGGSCEDDPGPDPSPTPGPTPPPTGGDPDTWDTAPLVTGLTQTFSIETRYINPSPSDPACTEDENGLPVAYDRSAWFHVRLPADASGYVSTAGSVATAGEDKPELDTVLMIMTRENDAWTVWSCTDDVDYNAFGVPLSVEAEVAFFFHGGTDYYVMAATYKDLEDPGNVPAGTLEVRFSRP